MISPRTVTRPHQPQPQPSFSPSPSRLSEQGLYLPVKAVQLPLDFSAHWLLLNPFGKDARYDALDSNDRPQYKPQAMPMKLGLDKGVPMPRMSDPKRMVFTDKMMS